MWRSLVARFVRDEEVVGSNPVTPTSGRLKKFSFFFCFQVLFLLCFFWGKGNDYGFSVSSRCFLCEGAGSVSCYNTCMEAVRIVLVSDNHGVRDSLKKLKEMYSDYDLFVHLGDSEMEVSEMDGYICVKGNNDFAYFSDIPYDMTLRVQGHTILMTHGHRIFRSYFDHDPLVKCARAEGADVVFFGHTHMPCDEETAGIRLLNPGSVTQNRDGSPPSYMLVNITKEKVEAEIKTFERSFGKEGGLLDRLLKFLMKGGE